jgi:hypothetical protein
MHVISASRRTDIPAFHSAWFMNRARTGEVKVVSPFGARMFEVSLVPKEVIAIVFWTKNPAPLLPYLNELRDMGHHFTFLYTINNYPTFLEPHVPGLSHTLKVVEEMATRFPPSVLRWRYDTIVLTETLDMKWHTRNFAELCRLLAPYASQCIFSFCDYYRKTIRNMELHVPDHWKPDEDQSLLIARELADIAAYRGISLESCAHDSLVSGRIKKARCIDPDFLAGVADSPEKKSALEALKTTPTRKDCACAASRDIGAYDTCGHGCIYCYANNNAGLARKNLGSLEPDAECLDPRYPKLAASS